MHLWRRIAFVLALLVGATACGGGATGVVNPCAPTSGSVVGCVTDSRGGSAVAGATITASPAGTTTTTGTTTTDSQGRYALSLSPETYDIVASKPGKAASKFQSVIVQSEQTTSANFTLNSTLLANGAAFVDIITYDLNQNVAEFVVGFTVNNAVSGSPPATPGVFLTAVTTGQSLGLFSAQRAQRFSTLHLTQDPNLMKVNGRSINLLTAPSNATLFVQVQWSNVGAVGYKVFRSFSAAGPFVQ